MHKQIIRLASAALLLMVASVAQAAVNEPYVADVGFGVHGIVSDPMVNLDPNNPARASGQRLVLDDDGSTVIASMATVWFMQDINYLVIARYDRHGQRLGWSHPSAGYADTSGKYLYVPPITAPENLRISAVQDVKIGNYGDIYVLVDALSADAETTDSLVVTFGPDGEYKGIVTHQATLFTDDTGVAILPWGSSVFIVSSAGTQVDMARYSINLNNGVPALMTSWGSSGRASQVMFQCHSQVAGTTIVVPCPLRARRAILAEPSSTPSRIYVAGEYGEQGAETTLFVMYFDTIAGASNSGFPTPWGFPGYDDGMRGLAFRSKTLLPQRSLNELYLLNAFPRPCGYGFVVLRLNADTGGFVDRSYTKGGSTNPDPNACAQVDSFIANNLSLAHDYTHASRYVAVVGAHVHGELYTGLDAFLALIDTQNLHDTVQIQDFTENAGQYPSDTIFNAVRGNVVDGSYTATGMDRSYDRDASSAVTMRLVTDKIFGNGFGFGTE
ncbi:MAG: hypothetical protein L0H70_03295 [Xanthomonadales bacterium]|nr:hypothetical protein [Xanthomonadales bacterium]